MKVTLVRVTEDPVGAIESAASNCYDSRPDGTGKLMRGCYHSGHHSVLEFANFHFHVEGVSRALLSQLTRHRMASFAVRSQRYVDEDMFPYVIPDSIQKNDQARNGYTDLMQNCRMVYRQLTDTFDIPKEDARYVLPNSCMTIIDFSINMRSLIHFMNERLCSRAQWEIRDLASKMKRLVAEQYPDIGALLVPKCEVHEQYPFCTERISCGRHPLLRDVYQPNKKSPMAEQEPIVCPKKLKHTYFIVGLSGSGKDSVVDRLCQHYNATKLKSYTTRPRRLSEANTHLFVTESEFDTIPKDEMIAYTEFDGYRYCATMAQLSQSDFYIMDPAGVRYFQKYCEHHDLLNQQSYFVIGLDVDGGEAVRRMFERGEDTDLIWDRLTNDVDKFRDFEKLTDVMIRNDDLDQCVKDVIAFIDHHEAQCEQFHGGVLASDCLNRSNVEEDNGGFRCMTNGMKKEESHDEN